MAWKILFVCLTLLHDNKGFYYSCSKQLWYLYNLILISVLQYYCSRIK